MADAKVGCDDASAVRPEDRTPGPTKERRMSAGAASDGVRLDDFFACCAHCGCTTDRTGHDDTCAQGCNDQELRDRGYDI